MANETVYYRAGGLTGGGSTQLDQIPHASIVDGDLAFTLDGGAIHAHMFDAIDTQVEASPDVIVPDDAGSTGRWLLQSSPFDVGDQVSVGTIVSQAVSTPPTGYLECDGAELSRTTYADLFAAIGDDFGIGDGVNTFNLPDFRGEFLRGWDHGAGNDPDAATRTDRGDGTTGDVIGSKQDGQNKAHSHTQAGGAYAALTGGSNTFQGTNAGAWWGGTTSNGGNEARPRNINVMFCIKY